MDNVSIVSPFAQGKYLSASRLGADIQLPVKSKIIISNLHTKATLTGN